MNFIKFLQKILNSFIKFFEHQDRIEENSEKTKIQKQVVNKKDTYIVTENKEITEEEYNLPAWLYTGNKNQLNNKVLKFTLNNDSKIINPDKTGKYIFPIKLINPGIYNIKIEFSGDEEYNASSITATINVKSKPKTSTTTQNNKQKTVNYKANSKGEYWSPRYLHGQDQKQYRSYWCAPTAITQIWYELFGDNLSQTVIAKIAGTTENGTSHTGINTALNSLAKKYNKKISIEWKNYSSISTNELAQIMANPNKSALFHVMWHNLNNWDDMGGHYCYYACINPSEKYFYEVYSLSGADLIKRTFNYVKTVTSEISQQSVCIVTKL